MIAPRASPASALASASDLLTWASSWLAPSLRRVGRAPVAPWTTRWLATMARPHRDPRRPDRAGRAGAPQVQDILVSGRRKPFSMGRVKGSKVPPAPTRAAVACTPRAAAAAPPPSPPPPPRAPEPPAPLPMPRLCRLTSCSPSAPLPPPLPRPCPFSACSRGWSGQPCATLACGARSRGAPSGTSRAPQRRLRTPPPCRPPRPSPRRPPSTPPSLCGAPCLHPSHRPRPRPRPPPPPPRLLAPCGCAAASRWALPARPCSCHAAVGCSRCRARR